MNEYVVKAPTPATWEGFEAMAARHNGVFGGCPRSWFYTLHDAKTFEDVRSEGQGNCVMRRTV
jgi:hypothetical protein